MPVINKIYHFIDYILQKKKEKEIIPIPEIIYDKHLLKGKIIFITGGTSGIGFAIAKASLNNGGKVIITSSTNNKLQAALSTLNSERAKGMLWNITEISTYEKNFERVLSLFPEHRIDVLINSAGLTQKTNFFDTTEEMFDKIINVNVKGLFFISKYIAEYFISQNIKGHILNISSSSAIKPAWGPYQISKWSVRGFTIGLAEQLAPYGITVNAIAPGKTATPMMDMEGNSNLYCTNQPSKRYISPSEIANMAVYLISDSGRMVMGDTIYMTGGTGFFE